MQTHGDPPLPPTPLHPTANGDCAQEQRLEINSRFVLGGGFHMPALCLLYSQLEEEQHVVSFAPLLYERSKLII